MSGQIAVVGIGPGDLTQLTAAARAQIEQSDILIGAQRMLAPFLRPGLRTYDLMACGCEAVAKIIEQHQDSNISVLASGDVGFYSIASVLRQLTQVPLQLIPGISSLQYFCACIGETWQDVAVMSLHGRQNNALAHVLKHPKAFFLLGTSPTVAEFCSLLVRQGLGQLQVVVGERLSYPDQRITRGTAQELAEGKFQSLAVMLVYNHLLATAVKDWQTPGLPDDLFIRGDVPMTKELVRLTSVCKLRLATTHVVYDVGAGTGSVAVECALQAKAGSVYAIERSPKACELIRQNASKFAAYNLHVVQSEAPAGLEELPPPDRVFVGGTGGMLLSILDEVLLKNPLCRIVINAILLESAADAVRALKERNCQVDVVQLAASVARPITSGSMMLAQNPIYIISGERGK